YTVMRNGGNGLYWCDDVCSSPEGRYPASCDGVFYRYPATDGAEYTDVDTCQCSVDDPVELVIKSVAVQVTLEEVEVPAGTFEVISYACTELGAAQTWTYSFAPGVGLVLVMIEANGTNEGVLELASYSLR
ncbi:MAG TPA: hypothetical protein VM118_12000, partial [Acidobacteriota bacterium]|nr:hypothetical protein [Acidobacteriota bacterium]